MRFSSSAILLVLSLSTVIADLPKICTNLKTSEQGCQRYVKGFDVTGVLTEFDLGLMDSVCDCIEACLHRPDLCANYVYKFTSAEGVAKNKRSCTLYSDFNLPSKVAVEFDLDSNLNKNIFPKIIIQNGNNPHQGAPVPEAFKDANLNTTADPDAVSGPVWQLQGGGILC